MIPEPPTADASLFYVAGPGDGYFVKAEVPSVVHHFHDGAWDTLPFTNFPAFSGVGTSATDVWLSHDGGLKGGHGDGQLATWSEYEVTAAPTDSGLVDYTRISLVSTGVGHVGVVGQRRDTDSGGDKVKAYTYFTLAVAKATGKEAEVATASRNRVAGALKPDEVKAARETASKCMAAEYKNCAL